jgi:hypothetical protein
LRLFFICIIDPKFWTMKICKLCQIEKPLKEYYKKTESKDGKHIYCKTCMKKEKKSYYKSNPRKEYFNTYRKENKEYFNNYSHNHYHTNKELYREWERERYATDLPFRIKHITSTRIHEALKTYQILKNDRTIEYLGCSIGDYCNYLELKFDDKMNWNNQGDYWHIDHIKPIAAFDLNNEEELYKCFHYSNTQPMEALENRLKSDKIL